LRENTSIKALIKCIDYVINAKKGFAKTDKPYSEGDGEIIYDISKERIFQIPDKAKFRNLGFVDGGSISILSSADFNINLTRIAGVLCKNNKISEFSTVPQVIEFYSVTVLEPTEDDRLIYSIQLFPREDEFWNYLPKEKITITLDEARSIYGIRFMPRIENFGGVGMRFSEWTYATQFIEATLDQGDIFVRDGSLQTGFKDEIKLVRKLEKQAEKKHVYVTGLSKSCRLLTKNGDSLISLIHSIASNKYKNKKWYYHPIYQITRADGMADVYFVKLHEHALMPFRFDIYLKQSKEIDTEEKEVIISNLALNSNDITFPGYPYGLIKVDQLSRVSKREIEPWKIEIISEIDQTIYVNNLLPRIYSIEAHNILNSIRKN